MGTNPFCYLDTKSWLDSTTALQRSASECAAINPPPPNPTVPTNPNPTQNPTNPNPNPTSPTDSTSLDPNQTTSGVLSSASVTSGPSTSGTDSSSPQVSNGSQPNGQPSGNPSSSGGGNSSSGSDSGSSGSGGSSNVLLYAGIGVAIVVIACIALGVFLFVRRRRRNATSKSQPREIESQYPPQRPPFVAPVADLQVATEVKTSYDDKPVDEGLAQAANEQVQPVVITLPVPPARLTSSRKEGSGLFGEDIKSGHESALFNQPSWDSPTKVDATASFSIRKPPMVRLGTESSPFMINASSEKSNIPMVDLSEKSTMSEKATITGKAGGSGPMVDLGRTSQNLSTNVPVASGSSLRVPRRTISAAPSAISHWTPEDVSTALKASGVSSELADLLKSKGVDGHALLQLDDQKLKDLGVDAFGARAVILLSVDVLRDGSDGDAPPQYA
ncbi:hypothetical protein HDU97_005882 [Phlyctochytrium planicorne]|nr:hypothetical protein HDU97_005882 [Phlyctochytrium planicorne]